MADSDASTQSEPPMPLPPASASKGYPHLSNAPIKEALIYFRAPIPAHFDLVAFRDVYDAEFRDAYPILQENRNFESTVNFNMATDAESRPGIVKDLGITAYTFRSTDGSNVAQFRQDGFVFSKLKPYTKWSEIFTEAWRLWTRYREIANPTELSRIGVRYINRMHLGLDGNDLKQYLQAPPSIAPNWPSAVASFFSQVVLHMPEIAAVAQVTQTLEKYRKPGILPLILDIDVFSSEPSNPADPALAGRFASLRDAKNCVFFGALTDKAVKQFQV